MFLGGFKFCAIAFSIFKALPLLASLSPESRPALRVGPSGGRGFLPGTGGHRVEPEGKHVQDGEGHLEACSSVGRCGHEVLRGACQEGSGDVAPRVHAHLNRLMWKES